MEAKDWINKRIIITRKDGSVRECEIMYDRNTRRYAFVNLTTHHVCECRFDTPEEAIEDLHNNKFVTNYRLMKKRETNIIATVRGNYLNDDGRLLRIKPITEFAFEGADRNSQPFAHNKAIYQPKGAAGEYAHFATNFYIGCSNDCTYCYNKRGVRAGVWSKTPYLKKTFGDAHTSSLYTDPEKDQAIAAFCADLGKIEKAMPEELRRYGVFFSFTTDPMLPETIDLTFRATDILLIRDIPVMILTKCTWGICNSSFGFYMDIMEGALTPPSDNWGRSANLTKLAFGFTLTGVDSLEPGAATNKERVEMMAKLKRCGFRTFASIEPVMDCEASERLIKEALPYCDHYMIGLPSGCKLPYSTGALIDFLDEVTQVIDGIGATVLLKESVCKHLIKAHDKGIEPELITKILARSVGPDFSMFDKTPNSPIL